MPRVVPRIVRRLPHDRTAFTQGLACHQGILYESTGRYGQSCLQAIDLKSGELLARRALPSNHWGEGIAILDDHIVQLTWKSQLAYVCTIPDLKVVDHHQYAGEGWGLSRWNDCYVMSDGSNLLTIRNKQFKVQRRLRVSSNRIPMPGLNDLQVLQDKIYANVYYRSEIVEIDMATGAIEQIVDCRELVRLAAAKSDEHILNGIAYDEDEGVFVVTGKNWPEIFVIEIPTTT